MSWPSDEAEAMSWPSDEAEAEVPQNNRTGETFIGPSFRFSGPSPVVTFNACVSQEVDLTFDPSGEGLFIFKNCEWINSHLNFIGEDDLYSFEHCTFTNTVLVGGPDLTEAQNDTEENETEIVQGQLSSFAFRGCTFVGSQAVDIEPGKTFPGNGQNFSFRDRDTSQESDAITFSNCVFALTGNLSGDAGMSQGQGAGSSGVSSAKVDDKGTPDSGDAPAN